MAKVSFITAALLNCDAVGNSTVDKARYFMARGDNVAIFYESVGEPPPDLASYTHQMTLSALLNETLPAPLLAHFYESQIYIYEYATAYELMESIKLVRDGLVLFAYHGVTPPDLWGTQDGIEAMQKGVEDVNLVHYADYAITDSEYTRQELHEKYNYPLERVFVQWLFIDARRFAPAPPDENLVAQHDLQGYRTLLYVGRTAGNKRVPQLVEALAIVRQTIPNVKLLLVGDNTLPPYLPFAEETRKVAARLGLSDMVIFTGKVSDEMLVKYYHLADIFVTASLHEGFCGPLIEAMAAGTPAIGTDTAAIPYTIGDAGLTFEPNNSTDLAEKVVFLVSSEDEYEEYVQRGLARAQLFTYEQYTRRLDEIFQAAQEQWAPKGVAIPPRVVEPVELTDSHKFVSPQGTATKVTFVAPAMLPNDAVGNNLVNKARYFKSLDYEIKIICGPAPGIPEDLRDNVYFPSGSFFSPQSSRDEEYIAHFRRSGIYIYDYPGYYTYMETMQNISENAIVFFDYHGVTTPELGATSEEVAILQKSVEQAVQVHNADYAIVHSDYMREEIVGKYAYSRNRVFVQPYAVPVDSFQPDDKDPSLVSQYGLEGQFVLLYVGRIAQNKRIDDLIRALAEVVKRAPNTKLLLVGNNTAEPYSYVAAELQTLAQELGVTDKVVFTGAVKHEVLPRYYSIADILVLASWHEGFCIPLIEAMACGKPVVGTATTAIPSTIGNAGLTFPPGDINALVEHIMRLRNDLPLYDNLAQQGLRRAQTFSLAAYYQSWDNILRASVGRGKVPLLPRQAYRPLVQQAQILFPYQVRSHLPIAGPLIEWTRRNMTSHLKEPYIDQIAARQTTFNIDLLRTVVDLTSVVETKIAQIHRTQEQLEHSLQQLQEQLFSHQDQLVSHQNQLTAHQAQSNSHQEQLSVHQEVIRTHQTSIDEHRRAWQDDSAKLHNRVDVITKKQGRFSQQLKALEKQVTALTAMLDEDPNLVRGRLAELSQMLQRLSADELTSREEALSSSPSGILDYEINSYVFNEYFGGSDELERGLYAPLVELFLNSTRPVDLGCGTGVFLELLREEGIDGIGVDLDDDMVMVGKRKGLDVVKADIFRFLEEQEDKSIDGILCAHVIEHIPRHQITRFFDLCYRKMQYGTPIVIITPNVQSLAIFFDTFYKDLTHLNPIHPETIKFVMEAAGFRRVQITYQSPTPDKWKLQLHDTEGLAREGRLFKLTTTLNANFARLNEVIFGEFDCIVSAVR